MKVERIKKYTPTTSEKKWLSSIMEDLDVGGLLITEIAMYRKTNENTIEVDRINDTAFALGFSDMQIEREITKMKITALFISINFVDKRPEKWN
tara:strand:+ start:3209 stop:3490 length:282 start_codon:yes stop_codon:yes gene_type:complete